MQITDLLKPQSVLLNADPVTKADAIYTLGELMEKGGNLIDKGEYLAAVFAREESGSTGLGDGIATPHAKSAGVKEAGLAAMVVPHGVDFEALDGQPSRLFFMIAAPEGAADTHVEVLSQLAMMVIDPDFKEALIAAPTVERFLELITAKEQGNLIHPLKDISNSQNLKRLQVLPMLSKLKLRKLSKKWLLRFL